jgi:hypothetical protein
MITTGHQAKYLDILVKTDITPSRLFIRRMQKPTIPSHTATVSKYICQ